MGTLTPSRAVPALPGAQKTCSARGDCASFQTRACSRPPLPMTSIFMRGQVGTEDGKPRPKAGPTKAIYGRASLRQVAFVDHLAAKRSARGSDCGPDVAFIKEDQGLARGAVRLIFHAPVAALVAGRADEKCVMQFAGAVQPQR